MNLQGITIEQKTWCSGKVWVVKHTQSGRPLQPLYTHWERHWHAEEYAHRISLIADWANLTDTDLIANRDLNKTLGQQMRAIHDTLTKELQKKVARWPFKNWKRKDEFYAV